MSSVSNQPVASVPEGSTPLQFAARLIVLLCVTAGASIFGGSSTSMGPSAIGSRLLLGLTNCTLVECLVESDRVLMITDGAAVAV